MNNELQNRKVLIVEDHESTKSQILTTALVRLSMALRDKFIEAVHVGSYCEGYPLVETDMDIDCFLVTSDMKANSIAESRAVKLLQEIHCRRRGVPVFLLADRQSTSEHMSMELMSLANEFAWIFEDSPVFLAGRIEAAIHRYRNELLPPLMRAIWDYNEENHEYSWAAPGHQGGIGFTKSPAGKKFFDFYGENLFRTDTGIERTSIGSLLDHTGAFHESEKMAAKIFGADESYSGIVGTSGSNRTVMQACLTDHDIAICDRNCHKSIEQGLILTGAIPVYMVPTRNQYGIIGPIHRSEMNPEAICGKIKRSPLMKGKTKLVYSVVTNCTYDGLCYNAAKVEEVLAKSVKRIHFDEAWYAYARFNPVYKDHYAMRGNPEEHKGPTVFATHSTHKLLNALSQASYIHIRHGDHPIDFDRFNQSYMMHTTTSPLYAICASNDISGAMMHNAGEELIRDVIAEAVDFRQAMARLHRDFSRNGSWFFKPWNPDFVTCPKTGNKYSFADAPRELLIREQSCWRMNPGAAWHGFKDLEDDWVLLDPIKVSILGPGMGDDGKLQSCGVPAALVSYYIYQKGIVPTRTTDFQLMFLFSMGITKGKWGTLLNALLNFKDFYDRNASVSEVLPKLAQSYPDIYGKIGIRDLSGQMFEFIKSNNPGEALNMAYSTLPEQVMTPRAAYEKIVSGDVEFVNSDHLENRISANSVIPYPPGIPMLMSGENFGTTASPQIRYLKSLEKWDAHFPGFEHETEGTKVIDGKYAVLCVK